MNSLSSLALLSRPKDSLFLFSTVQSLINKDKTSAYIVEDTDVESNIKAKHMFQEVEAKIYAAISCAGWHSHSEVLSS